MKPGLRVRLDRRAVGLGMLAVIVSLSLLVPLVSPYHPDFGGADTLAPPSLEHPFGTDQLGRDVFTRAFAAGRLDLAIAAVGTLVPMAIGILIGAVAGTSRSRLVDAGFQVIVEAINAFPFIILVIGVVSMVGAGIQGLIIGLIAFNWARYARIVRARTLSIRHVEYLEAARVLGYSRARILLRHVLPNVSGEAGAYALSDFVLVVITVSGLSYLGLGVQPPASEWGSMMADGRLYLQNQWWLTVTPGLVLCFAALGVAIVAQGMRLRSAETWLAR